MILALLIVLALTSNVSGVCEDDLVPLEAGNLPAVWDIGNMPHLFYNSKHLRGVGSVRDMKILGLDTVTTSLKFCPVDMTIYGNLTGRRIEFVGSCSSNFDYIREGSQTFGHGDGEFDLILSNLEIRNIVAPLRYSRATKRLQIDEMQYEISLKMVKSKLIGTQVDGESSHVVENEEFSEIDRSSSFPTFVEVVRALINAKAPKGLLAAAAKQIFGNALLSL